MKRSRLRPRSAKRVAEQAERQGQLEERFGPREEWRCQFGRVVRFAQVVVPISVLPCHGEVNGHEVLKRSRGGSITDMDNVLLLCNYHNDLVEDEPTMAHALRLAPHHGEAHVNPLESDLADSDEFQEFLRREEQ